MAHLKRIPFQSQISSHMDEERNSKLEKGIVLVETIETQAVLSKLPSADVDRLADALNKLLDVLNARHAHDVWSWHLALTVQSKQGGEQHGGGPGPSPE